MVGGADPAPAVGPGPAGTANEPAAAPAAAAAAPEPAKADPARKAPAATRTGRTAAPKSATAKPKAAKTEASRYRLSAIGRGPDGNHALINERVVQEGQTVLDAKVVKIGPNYVELEAAGARFTIRL
jgi:hypothetical protein